MIIKVEVKNKILGDSVFWEGDSKRVSEIRNLVARRLARAVAEDGRSRKNGIWVVSGRS